MANRIQLRRGSAQEWSNVNPTLAIGELGIEIDTGRIKIGDGVTAWNSLRYERPLESVASSPNTLVQRDADGNFSAGAITASLIGNAATATRLANVRQIALTGEMAGSATFDGSSNLNISATLAIVPSLPHYDGTPDSEATYTRVTVDAKGRVIDAENPTTIQAYGIDGIVEGQSAQGFDRDLQGIADLTTTGHIVRVSDGNITTRTVTGTAGRISVVNGSGVAGNPTLDLINTSVSPATYNTPTVASATQTIKATRFTVDQWGRLTYAEDFNIATAVEGTTAGAWTTGTGYSRYDKVTNAGRLYQALDSGNSGATAPVHTTGDASDGTVSWRHLGLVTTRQKGLASFDQEDFDVDVNGHVQIASAGVDNTQLQNNQIRFADGNSYTAYELDNELTSSTGYRGITTINDLSVNNTGGSPLLKCLAADDNVDINTTTATIFSDVTLDKTSTAIQTINRAGSLTLLMNANTASNRFLRLTATNAGAGEAKIEVSAEDSISIDSINSTLALTAAQQISLISSADVRVEDIYFSTNTISSTNSTIVLDPAGIGDDTGTVQIKGNLQVDGVTTTVNSTTITIDDVILTLGGDQTPTTDDNKDRGIEFKYYDTQARLGFYGWDDSYTTLAGTTGGYRFLYNATNTSEVFSGTDAGVIAGNLALSSNVGSTSTTTGTLVVTGGAGISENLWVGGTANVAGNTTLQGTLGVTNLATFNNGVTIAGNTVAATEYFRITDGAGTPVTKFLVDTATGNTTIQGTVTVTDNVTLNKNVTIIGSNTAATEYFKIQNASAADKFVVDSSSGNTSISGTLGVTGASTLTGTLTFQSGSYLVSNNIDVPTITTDIGGNYIISGGDYGSFRFDGGGYIEGDTLFNDNIYVNGTIVVKDTGGGGTASTVNNLAVRYTTTLGSTLPYTPAFATSTSSNLRVTGGAGIATTLHIGGTGASEGLYVGKKNSGDTAKFSVLGASGNTSISGTLGVTGATTLSSTLGVTGVTTISNTTDSSATNIGALVVSGGAGIASQLRVGGATTLGSTLYVSNAATLNNNLTVNGSSTLGDASADTLTVNATSTFNAPVTISGSNSLSVGGNITITGDLTVNGTTTTVNSVTMTIDDKNIELGSVASPSNTSADGGGITLKGTTDKTLSWINATTAWTSSEHFNLASGKEYRINGTAVIDSSRNLVNIQNITNSGNLTINTNKFVVTAASGNTSIAGTLGVTGSTTLSSTLGVTGATTLSSTLGVTGDFAINSNKFNVTAASGNTAIAGTLGVTGATSLNSTLGVSGITSITNGTQATTTGTYSGDGAFRVTGGASVGGNFVVQGDLKVYGAQIIDGDVSLSGTQSYSGVIKSTNTTDATSSTSNLSAINTDGGLAVAKQAWIGSNTNIGGTLAVTGATTLSSTLGVTGVTTLTGALVANGNVTLGDASTDSLTVNASSSFVSPITVSNTFSTTSTVTLTGGTLSIKDSGSNDRFIFNPATGAASITGSLSTTGNGTIGGTLGVTGATTLSSTLAVTSGTTLSSTLAVTGAATLSSTLAVTGLITANAGLTISGSAGAGEDFIITDGTNTKFSVTSAAGNTLISGTLGVSGAATLSSTLTVTGTSIFTGAITANGGVIGALTGNASTATTLQNARTIGISGDGTGTATSFNGSANITIPFTLSNSGVTAGTYTKITVDAKGRATSATNATTSDISEGTNLYYTQGRFDTAFGSKSTSNLTEGSNLYYTQARFDTAFNAKTTSNLTEGTNLYYTDERAQDAAAAALTTNASHNGVTVTYNDAGNAINISRNTLIYSNVTANGTGVKDAYLADSGRSSENILVIVNGLISTPAVDYSYYDQTVLSNVSGHRGENTITVPSAGGLVIGQPVSGNGIASGATITNISGTTITLSANNLTYLRRAEISTIGTPSGIPIAGEANQSYTAVASTSSGSGTGATFNVTRGSSGQITGVTVNNGGTNYINGEVITISGLLVGGSSSAENITFLVASTNTTTTTATFSPVVKFTSAPTAGVNNVSIRYLPL
jgi:hypothetical protein